MEGAVNLVQLKKTKAQAKRYNTNMRRVVTRLETFSETRPRRSNDIHGDVGYTIALFAGDAPAAARLAEALVAEGVSAHTRGPGAARDWHIYNYWEHLLEQKTATPEGCPFTCPYYKGPRPKYRPDMCPATLDLMSRAVFIHVNQWWNATDCRNVAAAVNKVCRVLG